MIQDWVITASTVRHAWRSILNAGWRRMLPIALAVLAVLVHVYQSSEVTDDTSPGKLLYDRLLSVGFVC